MTVDAITLQWVSPEGAANPNSPPATLLFAAGLHPNAVLANPVLPLLSLEDPALWQKIIEKAYSTRLEHAVRDRKPTRLESEHKWKAILRHILPVFTAAVKGDSFAAGVLSFLEKVGGAKLPRRKLAELRRAKAEEVDAGLSIVKLQREYAIKHKTPVHGATLVAELYFNGLRLMFEESEEPIPLAEGCQLANMHTIFDPIRGVDAWVQEVIWQETLVSQPSNWQGSPGFFTNPKHL